jgi:putative heme-binding domain-containing protein
MKAVFALALAAARLAAAQTTDPLASLTTEDLATGKRLFAGHCAPCHGIDGHGGKGANIAVPRLKHAADNQALVAVIHEGIEGTGMLPTWQLNDVEVVQVAGHVRSLGRVARATVPGDPNRGRTLYQEHGCAACHATSGQGSSLGPDLTEVGARRGAAFLRTKLTKPSEALSDGFAMVRAVTHDGRELRGFRVNEDSFTIQFKDAANRFYSFRKGDLAQLEKEFDKTLMPSFATKLTPSDLDDLTAYLAGLRGDQ